MGLSARENGVTDRWRMERERERGKNGRPVTFHVLYFQREFTPLHHAAAEGHPDICRSLIRAGSNVNAQNFVSCHCTIMSFRCRSHYHLHHRALASSSSPVGYIITTTVSAVTTSRVYHHPPLSVPSPPVGYIITATVSAVTTSRVYHHRHCQCRHHQ